MIIKPVHERQLIETLIFWSWLKYFYDRALWFPNLWPVVVWHWWEPHCRASSSGRSPPPGNPRTRSPRPAGRQPAPPPPSSSPPPPPPSPSLSLACLSSSPPILSLPPSPPAPHMVTADLRTRVTPLMVNTWKFLTCFWHKIVTTLYVRVHNARCCLCCLLLLSPIILMSVIVWLIWHSFWISFPKKILLFIGQN